MICRARTMRPPNAWPMAWWPRHTPSIGTLPAKARTASSETPASSGVHGPGEMTMRSGRMSRRPAAPASSLRTTLTSAPSSPRYCTRFQVNES